jgi:hypothetical protein
MTEKQVLQMQEEGQVSSLNFEAIKQNDLHLVPEIYEIQQKKANEKKAMSNR